MFPTLFSTKNNEPYTNTGSELISKNEIVPIINGIPRFVPNSNYSSSFGVQWNEYRQTQLDSYTGIPITEDRLRRCFGDPLFSNLKGKVILEAGCGAGRFTEILLKQGAKVVSVDLSSAVDANLKNFPIDENHIIIQADINNLPFDKEQFDVVLCLGVIQHTKNSEKTIADLFKQVKFGGWLIIDHYTHSLSYYTKTGPLLRKLYFRSLTAEQGMISTKKIVDVFFPLHRFAKNSKLLQMLISRVSPVATYFHSHPQLSDKLQYEWALLDTHDYLTDFYKHFRSKAEIKNILLSLSGINIEVSYGGNGVEARCQKKLTTVN